MTVCHYHIARLAILPIIICSALLAQSDAVAAAASINVWTSDHTVDEWTTVTNGGRSVSCDSGFVAVIIDEAAAAVTAILRSSMKLTRFCCLIYVVTCIHM